MNKVDATGFILGESQRRVFEKDPKQPHVSALKFALSWAERVGAEVLEIASPPYRAADRKYYVRNPGTGKMNRTSYGHVATITLMVREVFGQENPQTKPRKRRLVSRIIAEVVKGMSAGPGEPRLQDVRRPISHGPNINRDVPSVSYPAGRLAS